jgi:hypothetical protein
MKVKFNKQAILKNRFWILVGVTAVLTLAGTFYLQLYGNEAVAQIQKKFKGEIDKTKTITADSNPAIIDFWEKKAEEAKKSQSEVWEKAYKDQEMLFKWAPEIETRFEFHKGKFAQDIKIFNLSDEKDWPKDEEELLHGKFINIQGDYCLLKTRKGKEKLFRMDNLTITDTAATEEAKKSVIWGNQFKDYLGKLLAVKFQTGKYFGDNLLQSEQDDFAKYYKEQIHDILKTVEPLDEKGNGVVQLRDWLYRSDSLPDEKEKKDVKFIRYVTQDWDIKRDFSKEAWIAQENIWIQKEIYQIIKRANDDISKFQGGEEKGAKGKYHFRNSTFALELILSEDKSLSFKITNLLQRTQKLDLNFRVQMSKTGTAPIIPISGLPLAPGKTHVQTIKFDKAKESQRTGVYAVEQLLTWETAAVKRIDHVSIGSIAPDDISHSQRNFPEPLTPFDKKDLPKEEKNEQKPDDVPGPKRRDFGGIGGPGGGGAGAGANKTPLRHGLWTDRYIDVSEQSRRIPVAVALIVDQDHVDRVLTHFNNSKLRFLESQVLLNHYSGSLTPPAADEPKKEGGNAFPPRFGPKGFAVPGGPGRERFIPGGPGNPGADNPPGDSQDLESNMELVVYGIMTLYQRYPARPQAKKE